MAASSESQPVVPQQILCASAMTYDITGINPSVTVANDGSVLVVYQHGIVGLPRQVGIFYSLGNLKERQLTWGPEQNLVDSEGCSTPKVTHTSKGEIVLVYHKDTKCFYRTALAGKMDNKSISWSNEQVIDEGSQPSVCLSDDHTVVVTFITNNHGYSRVGTVDFTAGKIMWKEDKQQIMVDSPIHDLSIAMNQTKDVVIAYRRLTGFIPIFNTISCKLGKIAGGHVALASDATEATLNGYYPSVTINDCGLILVMFQHLSFFLWRLLVHCGVIQNGTIQWRDKPADSIDNGHSPSVCLTNKDEFIEVHTSNIKMFDGSLFFRIGELK